MKGHFGIRLTVAAACLFFFHPAPAKAEEPNIQIIERVVDANTAILKGGTRIRFIGVQAPDLYDGEKNSKLQASKALEEKKLFELGYEAKQFAQYLVQGQKVRLELEPQFASFGHKDREGNILAYVWFTSPVFAETPDWLVMDPNLKDVRHDAFLNAILVRSGFAEMDRRWPFSHADRFLALEDEAKEHRRFLWHPEGLPGERKAPDGNAKAPGSPASA